MSDPYLLLDQCIGRLMSKYALMNLDQSSPTPVHCNTLDILNFFFIHGGVGLGSGSGAIKFTAKTPDGMPG